MFSDILKGGDFLGDLTEHEIDKSLKHFEGDGKKHLILEAGSVKNENHVRTLSVINRNEKSEKPIFMPFWCRHHWLTFEIRRRSVHVYDSAPSEAVRNDILKWCAQRNLQVKFEICPRQRRYSRECGIFVIGVIIGRIHGRKMIDRVVSLEHLRERMEKGERPNLEMFNDIYEIQGGGQNEEILCIQEMHDRCEGFAAQRNLCFVLTAMCMVKKGCLLQGRKMQLEIDEPTIMYWAKTIGAIDDSKTQAAEVNDIEDALMKMSEKGLSPIKIVTLNEVEDMEKGDVAFIMKGDEDIELPNTIDSVAAAVFNTSKYNYHQAKDGSWHRTAYGGHYKYQEGKGTVVLGRCNGKEKQAWSVAAELKKIAERNRCAAEKEVHVQTTTKKNITNNSPHEIRPIRHARVRATAKMNAPVIGHWVLNGETARMIGSRIEEDDDEPSQTLMSWEYKQCICGKWRQLEQPITGVCPIPRATYIEFRPAESYEICDCGGDDDDEDTTGPGNNEHVEEQWREQESLEPLGKIGRKVPVSMITGGIGRNWKLITKGKPRKVHTLVWQGLAESTRKKHVEWLRHITEMPVDLHEESLDRAIVEMVLRIAKERKWAWSTVSCILSTIQSALRSLDLYTTETINYDLRESEYFTAATRRAQKLARNAGPSSQLSTPMTYDTMIRLFKSSVDMSVRALLIMSWAFAARVGDMRQVEAKNVKLPPNNDRNSATAITFKKGKGGAFWGAFTIHTVLPLDAWKDIGQLLKQRKTADSIWTTGDQRKLSAMVSREGLTLRAIRRGALLHNAHRGVSDTDLQYLSGHKRIDTLMRYLGWGVESTSSKKAAQNRHILTGGEGSEKEVEPKKMGAVSGYQGNKGKREEKPPKKYHFRPPSSQQLGIKKNAKTLPLHVKVVGTAKMEVINRMALESARFGKDCLFAAEHLTGKPYRKYIAEMPEEKNIPKAGFTREQVKKLVEHGKLVPLEGTGKSWVKGFPIVDGHKDRARPLAEPYVNTMARKEFDYPLMSYLSTSEQYAKAKDAVFMAQFDYSAYFDQFRLDEEAQDYMVLRTVPYNKTTMWKLTVLPMGATFSPCIAQYVTWVICDPVERIEGVTVTTMIDNVRICAKTEKEFLKAVRLFLKRSEEAGLTLNSDADPYRTQDDKKLLKLGRENTEKDFEFLGVCYNKNTVRNSQRLVDKMNMAEKLLDSPDITRRQLAHIIGLAIFMAHTIKEDMVHHFELMRLYNKLFEGYPDWDEVFRPTEQLSSRLRKLIKICVDNKRVPITEPVRPSNNVEDYDAVVVFDACKDAWAAKVHLIKENKRFRVLKRFDKQIKFSAHTEPTAAKEILIWLRNTYKHVKRVALVTDHMALAMGQKRWWTGYGGHSTAFHINEAFKEINDFAQVFHVDGEHNICDEDSRSSEARMCKIAKIIECNEKWYGLENCTHPYIDARKNFKYF